MKNPKTHIAGVLLFLFAIVLLGAPDAASATRPATEQEIGEFRRSAQEIENITTCGQPLGSAVASSCQWTPRTDYEPFISEARVSTVDETWATAYLAPAPRTVEAATVIFRREVRPEGTVDVWRLAVIGNGCGLAERSFGGSPGAEIHLAPDLALALGCTPVIATKVRCLDKLRTSLLALGRPRQCAVSPPERALLRAFGGWMNIRELRWHAWGDEDRAWAEGVIAGVPARLRKDRPSAKPSSRKNAHAKVAWPPAVRVVASGRVSCGTSYFYSRLRVVSPFGRFTVKLSTCPDQFFAPA